MARWTGTWITGTGAPSSGGAPPGRLGRPGSGPGSVASFGARAGAFALDAVLAGLVARLFFPVRDLETAQTSTSLAPVAVLTVVYLVGLLLVGQTPGMRLLRLRVVPVQAVAGEALGLVPAALRTALLLLLVPALIVDRDGRGLHDRAAGAVVVRA
jgi:uncharacterized RDD family membrane protein YckC